jgi:N-hydroxyarylamine O-acetyltransferase
MPTGLADLSALDLDAYLRRVRYAGDLNPAYPVLAALHLAHAANIPFENLDILLGRPVRLDLGSLQAKLVTGRRGGYCFEQNILFAAVLERLGFAVTPLAARVRYGVNRIIPRTHMLLLVRCDGGTWVADVGFGREGLLLPVPFASGRETRHYGRAYRVVPEQQEWTLQMLEAGSWIDLYTFLPDPQTLADYEMANHYTSTHPDSPFLRTLVVQLPSPEARRVLRNRELTIDNGRSITRRTIAGDAELLDVLAEVFDLRFRGGTRFPFQDDGA